MTPLRLTLVEDHTLLAQSLLLALSAEGIDVTIVGPGRVADATELLPRITSGRPHVVLLDLDLGTAGDGAPLIGPLREAGCAVVVVTGVTQRLRWGECLARGAATVLPKSAPLEAITSAARAAAAGGTVMAPAAREELLRAWQESRRHEHGVRGRFDRLSRREVEILGGLVAGRRVRDIAADTFVSESTVRSQVKSILAKLGVTSQIAAVAMARQAGWDAADAASARSSRRARPAS